MQGISKLSSTVWLPVVRNGNAALGSSTQFNMQGGFPCQVTCFCPHLLPQLGLDHSVSVCVEAWRTCHTIGRDF